MGRKVKQITVLVILLAMAFLLCGTHMEFTYAKEDIKEEQIEPEQPEQPEEPEIPIERFQLENSPPDGNNGYYRSAPKVTITHVSKRGITRYKFTDVGGHVTEGELTEQESTTELPAHLYKDGSNQLVLWMEDEEGNRVVDTELVREFYVDTIAPQFELSAPNGLDSWYQKETRLKVSSTDGDTGSSIERIACYYGNQTIGVSENAQAAFLVGFESKGGDGVAVNVVVTDRAGNKSERVQKLYIDHSAPTVSIQGTEDYTITSRPIDISCVAQEDNRMQEVSATVAWEKEDGQSVILPKQQWAKNDLQYSMNQRLQEDGLYKISALAIDKAGYRQEQHKQVIIDTKNPIIRFVDQVNNKTMREFQWDYPVEEIIRDYSSYVYEIKLDGKPYQMGTQTRAEGVHQLKVKAMDAAGNEAAAQATFVIDRTPPVVRFGDVEDNKAYEEEKTVKIRLENQNDIVEEIYINGQPQKTNGRSKVYDYTLKEYGDYLIAVKAVDNAGNRVQSQIGFRVEKKKTVLEKMIQPIQQRLQPEQKPAHTWKKVNETKAPIIPLVAVGGVVSAVLITALVLIVRYRKQQKNSP